jgi:hypothetical protein
LSTRPASGPNLSRQVQPEDRQPCVSLVGGSPPAARARTRTRTLPSQAWGPVSTSTSGKQSWGCEVERENGDLGGRGQVLGSGHRGLWRPFLACGGFTHCPEETEDQSLAAWERLASAGGGECAQGGARGPRAVRGHALAGARGGRRGT